MHRFLPGWNKMKAALVKSPAIGAERSSSRSFRFDRRTATTTERVNVLLRKDSGALMAGEFLQDPSLATILTGFLFH